MPFSCLVSYESPAAWRHVRAAGPALPCAHNTIIQRISAIVESFNKAPGGFRTGPHPGIPADFAAVGWVLANNGQFRTAVAAKQPQGVRRVNRQGNRPARVLVAF